MKKVFVITGEHSGDIHAGKVVQILKEQNTEIEIHGIGGENLKKAGATIFCDHSKMSGFGLNFNSGALIRFKPQSATEIAPAIHYSRPHHHIPPLLHALLR
jgi:lipid A disaccharide synthetase